MELEIKPCPFCGNTKLKVESKHHGNHYYEGTHSATVRCSKCHARGPTASCKVEEEHMKRFMQIFERIKGHELFTAPMEVKWRCTNCGYVHVGTTAPNECPACLHEQGYFERV